MLLNSNLAKSCDFQDVAAEIRAQILQKTSSRALRREILKHPKWTLSDVLEEARTMETSEIQACDIEGATATAPTNKVSSYKERNRRKQKKPEKQPESKTTQEARCRNCGYEWPHPRGNNTCPAKGKTCSWCRKKDHFESVCRANQQRKP